MLALHDAAGIFVKAIFFLSGICTYFTSPKRFMTENKTIEIIFSAKANSFIQTLVLLRKATEAFSPQRNWSPAKLCIVRAGLLVQPSLYCMTWTGLQSTQRSQGVQVWLRLKVSVEPHRDIKWKWWWSIETKEQSS